MTTRRTFIREAGCGLAGLAASGIWSRLNAVPERQRPNIVLFLVDDMGWQDTSEPFFRERTPFNKLYRTPNMERLARQGVKFTQAYACCVCSPTRISLMTGMNAARHRVTNWTLRRNISTDEPHETLLFPEWNVNGMCPTQGVERTALATPLPALLHRGGYYTIHCGKAHFGAIGTPAADPRTLGFDVNIAGHAAGGPGSHQGEHDYSAAWRNGDKVWDVPGLEAYHGTDTGLAEALTREALKALRKPLDEQKPFFLYMSHYAVHAPIEEDARFAARYKAMGLDPIEARYASMIEGMDKSLGDIMAFLEAHGIADKTVVLFMSDNGGLSATGRGGEPNTHNKPLSSGKGSAREGGVREPMIVRWPGVVKPDTVNPAPLIIEDFFPTLLEIAGIDYAPTVQTIDGLSFAPLLRGAKPVDTGRPLVWHFPNNWGQKGPGIGAHSAIRRGDWKLIYYHADRRFELFNLAEDIGEADNRIDRDGSVADALAALLTERLKAMSAQMPIDKRTGRQVEWPDEARKSGPSARTRG
ncbi:MAG: sulfatase [Candidatus Aminicenantes bacterium]|nr:sulfatase [Candidatus Aminicenantes bacterium]